MSGTAIPRTHIDQIPCILSAGSILQSSLVQTTGSQIKTSFFPTFYLCYFVLSGGGGGGGMEAIQKLHLLSIKKPSYI